MPLTKTNSVSFSESSVTMSPVSSHLAMDEYIEDSSSDVRRDVQGLSSPTLYNDHHDVIQQLGDSQFPFEDSELIYKSFEPAVDDRHARASYFEGRQLRQVASTALEPIVRIVFLPGADRMSVAALEQKAITKEEPNQKTPQWRVQTAGTLLCNFEVDDNLHVTFADCTPNIARVVRQRLARETANQGSQTALVLRRGDDRIMTIDSDNVRIISDLSAISESTDIEATLIEVDKSSLFNLITKFRQFLTTDAKGYLKLLEVMIEDARRLAIRSPVLFRMSTRQRIIHSRNTRYGVDHGTMFETITTSTGIKNIILKSDQCYHSLSNPGRDNHDQDHIKPRFLQMLALLISLLNDNDLHEIAEFLELNYKMKADRSSIELLVLKTLPLASINSKIFVREMINAVEQAQYARFPDDEEEAWNIFINRLLARGYILPGYTEQMGQPAKSWIVAFPPGDGFKDSYVFNNLQYQDPAQAFNDIPPIDLGTDSESREVTVVLTNGCRYLIDNADNQKIISMTYGDYSLTEADGQRRTYDLNISEDIINDQLIQAIQKTNKVLGIINSYLASSKLRGKLIPFVKENLAHLMKTRDTTITIPDIRSCGRLTFHAARVAGHTVAVAYKVEGKKVSRRDLIRNLTADARKVRSTLMYIITELDRYTNKKVSEDVRQTMMSLRQTIPQIHQLLGTVDQTKHRLESVVTDISDEPIVQTIYPGSDSAGSVATFWATYSARLVEKMLQVTSRREQVCRVVWANEEIAEVYFIDEINKFFVSPLRRLRPEEHESEIKPGDKVLLMGQYLVIVDHDDPYGEDEPDTKEHYEHELPAASLPAVQRYGNNGVAMNNDSRIKGHADRSGDKHANSVKEKSEIFVNWMKIVAVEKRAEDRRRHNRVKKNRTVPSVFQ